jgi:hypothetical protein
MRWGRCESPRENVGRALEKANCPTSPHECGERSPRFAAGEGPPRTQFSRREHPAPHMLAQSFGLSQ